MSEPSPVELIFFEALDKATDAERSAYISRACGGDEALRCRVTAMLAAHPRLGGFLEHPVTLASPDTESDGVAAADLSFLAPSDVPGSLGRLEHYEILKVVGRGGMGVVFRARDIKLGRVVALKALAGPQAQSAASRRRFAREARAVAAVRDDHVVAVHAVRDDAPVPYLVMEYVEGGSLAERLRREGPLPVEQVLRLGAQVARGLDAAHRQGLVHRDIKPANILLEAGDLKVKLTDFGLARAVDDASVTQPGMVAGTPRYMSPEQARGEPVDARSDLFSLGAVLYTLCTGAAPFRAESSLATLELVCVATPRPIRALNPAVPPALCAVIERLLAKRPQDRYGSAAEVADVLTRLLADPHHGGPSRPRRRWPWAVAALVVALALAVAAGVIDLRGTIHRGLSRDEAPVVEPEPPPDERTEWERSVAALPAEQQLAAVVERLHELHPRFDKKVEHTIRDGAVVRLKFLTYWIDDLSPLRALRRLESLECTGTVLTRGLVTDLTPLRGLPLRQLILTDNSIVDLSPLAGMPLEGLILTRNLGLRNLGPLKGSPLVDLNINLTAVSDLTPLAGAKGLAVLHCDQTQVTNLSPLRGLSLKNLSFSYTRISDLSPLRGMPLEHLSLIGTPVTDLSPLASMTLKGLDITATKVTDLSPLRGMPLVNLWLTYRPERDEAVLRSLRTLQRINFKTPAEFWKEMDGK